MKKYVIKQNTMYIRGIKVNEQTVHTEVSEAGKSPFIVKQKPQEIMNHSCRFYGEHFQERKLFTKRLTSITSKPPILVSPVTSTYFFCTHSERSAENTWINLLYVKHFTKYKGDKTKIFLEQDQSLVFPISFHIINHQYLNCTCLYYKNHRNNIFIKQLNMPNIDLTQDGYSVLDVIKMYLKNHH
ncbi:competence protein ComK [Mammaliicoccus vitulinus]|uniref:competence protein ComK n=1 Tax=Mammaliicoccus vitulinus TaxID=71237 RepID=UPI003BA36088